MGKGIYHTDVQKMITAACKLADINNGTKEIEITLETASFQTNFLFAEMNILSESKNLYSITTGSQIKWKLMYNQRETGPRSQHKK